VEEREAQAEAEKRRRARPQTERGAEIRACERRERGVVMVFLWRRCGVCERDAQCIKKIHK
jgi:hypothetical protein